MREVWPWLVDLATTAAVEAGRPSATAQRVAMRRAAHQLLDQPVVFDDPLALRIVGPENEAALRADPRRFEPGAVSPYLRAFFAVRSRHAEDALRAAVARGTRQYVILGAGLDTFAYRNPYPASTLRVFEVDHPATQAWKRGRLAEAGIAIPDSLTFVPLDFETRTLAEGLRQAGFDAGARTFVSWLGVTMYLTDDAIAATLAFVAGLPAGSAVVFDYALDPAGLDARGRAVRDALATRVARAGEPWRTFFAPAALATRLAALGFGQVEDLGPEALNARYCGARADALRVGSLAHLAQATV